MQKVPLSATPIIASDITEILRAYEGKPAMQIVDDFEAVLRQYTGSKYVVALNSGTAAIHLALKSLGVGPGDSVMAPTFTYVATVNPIVYLGADPIFIDSEPLTWNLSPVLLEEAINDQVKKGKKPRCLIVVHGYGMPAMMKEIQAICSRFEIPILEDAAESIGSKYQSRLTGTMGEVGIFSFNNNKIITTYGGGALITQNEGIYKKTLFWATQSREDKSFYEHTDLGFNYRMGPLNAAAGLLGMKAIEAKISERRLVFDAYKSAIQNVKWLEEPQGYFSNRWLSTMVFNSLNINDIVQKLEAGKFEFRRLWNPMHLQPYYHKYYSYVNGLAEQLFSTGLCLPSGDLLHVDGIIKTVNTSLLDSVGSR